MRSPESDRAFRRFRGLTRDWTGANTSWRSRFGERRYSIPDRLLSWEGFSPWNASCWDGFSPWNHHSSCTPHDRGVAISQVPPKSEERLRLFSLNAAHGRRNAANNPFVRHRTVRRNISAIADTVKALTPDIVALQEADGPSTWSGNFDHVATLARQAELSDHYRGEHNWMSFGRFNATWGTALLARQPLREPASHRFGMSWRDTKGFVVATVAVPEWGEIEVDVVSVHLDFLIPRVRRRQILHMVERLIYRQRPLVVLGDLNCCFEREPKSMRLLVETLGLRAHQPASRAPTYPSRRPRRRLDWILISEDLDYHGYHTVPVPLSDHLVLVADLHLRN